MINKQINIKRLEDKNNVTSKYKKYKKLYIEVCQCKNIELTN